MAYQDKKQPTAADYLNKAKSYFKEGNLYPHLTKMKDCQSLNQLLEAIKNFVEAEGGKEKVTTHQLRNIYEPVKRLKKDKKDEVNKLHLMRPTLAYIGARHEKMRVITHLLDDLIQHQVTDDVHGFQQFVQSLVAYQKYFQELKSDQTNV